MARTRSRFLKPAEEGPKPVGSIMQLTFDCPPNTFLAIFDADVRIECDRGQEKAVAEHIRQWVGQKLMSLYVPPEETAEANGEVLHEKVIG